MNGTVWVTGAGGLIGSALVQAAKELAPGCNVIGWTRDRLDLTNWDAVERKFEEQRPQVIFHCAAISRSPICEADPDAALLHNVRVTSHLARLARDSEFVFLSTDLVFDGKKGGYIESDPVNPLSVYGRTKWESETEVLSNSRHLVIRTSLNGGTSPTGDRGFNEQMRQAWKQGKSMKLFVDEFRSPISADATACALWDLALSGRTGLYHIAGSERLSRWEIGSLLASLWPELSPVISRGLLSDYSGAPRPPDTSLNCSKAAGVLKSPLPRFSEWLATQSVGSF